MGAEHSVMLHATRAGVTFTTASAASTVRLVRATVPIMHSGYTVLSPEHDGCFRSSRIDIS